MEKAALRVAVIAPALIIAALGGCTSTVRPGLDRRPIAITEPLDGSSRARLAYATSESASCQAWLAAAAVPFRPVADQIQSETCRVIAAGTLQNDGVRYAPPRPMMTCPLAAAVSLWRRQAVDAAALEIFGARVTQIDHLGVYACRPVNNTPGARPSAHARASAMDIAGVRLSDGRRISVKAHWSDGAAAEGRFLRRIRDGACQVFQTTLSPDYNLAHADHLHLELGEGRICR
ncbi:extensin family protein [Caulobacter segnis]|nr:extensin family protein [Caulobacter segnis]